jgi:hypothetical protein
MVDKDYESRHIFTAVIYHEIKPCIPLLENGAKID